MNDIQESLDLLFEQPSTIKGFRNKIKWIRETTYEMPFKHNYFQLFMNVLNDTVTEFRNLMDEVSDKQRKYYE